MAQAIAIGIAAGVAAALLFLAPTSGSALALPLLALTGLPIAIAGLGWGVAGAVIAALAGTAAAFAFTQGTGALIFFSLFGAPIAWLTRLAGLSRPVDRSPTDGERQWYRLGHLLLHAAIAVAIGLVVVGVAVGYEPEQVGREVAATLMEWLASGGETAPTAEELEPLVRVNVAILPIAVAVLALAVAVFNLWLGARVARASGRFSRPVERMWTVVLPGGVLPSFAVATMLTLVPGALGQAAAVFAGTLGMALALTGLAVMHALTLGVKGRGVILTMTYAFAFVSGLPLILLMILGVGESLFDLRARRFGGAPPQ